MKEKGGQEAGSAFDHQREIFQRYFPSGRISLVDGKQIPKSAMKHFEMKSALLINPDEYQRNNFDRFFAISQDEGGKTYVAQQIKTYWNGETEQLMYLYEINGKGKYIGRGEIRKNISNENPYFKDKPFVGYTYTDDGYKRRGLGVRRILMMNALSQMSYGLPLHSSEARQYAANKGWEKLEDQGKAIKYEYTREVEGGTLMNDRFVVVFNPQNEGGK